MPCTTILVGKKASYDGSTLMARNEDAPSGVFRPKKLTVVNPQDQPRHYHAVLNGFEMDLPDNPMRYTSMPNAFPDRGVWGEAGINECNVAMSETETLTSNALVLGADPLVADGIGEEDMLTVVLPYIHSAREGVLRLGEILEKYGTWEMNGIGFQDVSEIWWLETIGGHHWIARRVPDDAYAVVPNQLGIDKLDLTDAFGEQKNTLCSPDLLSFIYDNHLDLGMDGVSAEKQNVFDSRLAFSSHTDNDHCYNTPRAWYMERCLNPHTYRWDGPDADFTPISDSLPWCLVPEHKLTVEDVKYVLSSYYQGTEYDPYITHGNAASRGKLRPIGINRNNFVAITQLRPYLPESVMAVEWISVASNAFNASVPFYANVRTAPEYLSGTTDLPTTENFYWANRMIGAMADAHYGECIQDIERYQLEMAAYGHNCLNRTDAKCGALKGEEASIALEAVNQELADHARKSTYDLLGKVLFTANMGMKNAFSRTDG